MSFYEDEVGEDYAKYCVYRPPASYVPRYTADKRWYWYKTQDSEGNFKFEIGSFQEKKADGVVVLMPTDRFDPVEYHEEELDGVSVAILQLLTLCSTKSTTVLSMDVPIAQN
jgi:hypothetical protein